MHMIRCRWAICTCRDRRDPSLAGRDQRPRMVSGGSDRLSRGIDSCEIGTYDAKAECCDNEQRGIALRG